MVSEAPDPGPLGAVVSGVHRGGLAAEGRWAVVPEVEDFQPEASAELTADPTVVVSGVNLKLTLIHFKTGGNREKTEFVSFSFDQFPVGVRLLLLWTCALRRDASALCIL